MEYTKTFMIEEPNKVKIIFKSWICNILLIEIRKKFNFSEKIDIITIDNNFNRNKQN